MFWCGCQKPNDMKKFLIHGHVVFDFSNTFQLTDLLGATICGEVCKNIYPTCNSSNCGQYSTFTLAIEATHDVEQQEYGNPNIRSFCKVTKVKSDTFV